MNATSWLEGLRTPEGLRALGVRAPQWVTVALALALAVQAAIIVTDLGGSARRPGLPPGGIDMTALGRRNALDIAGLVNAHLFGAAPPAGANGLDAAHAPATNMALVLAGVLAADDPSQGLAILGQAANNAKVYSVGQNLPGGAKLHAVYDDRVILERNGALESLMLPHGAVGRGAAPPPVVANASAPGENPLLDKMRRLITSDPNVVGEILRPQPVFTDGKMNGYRVYPGRNRAAFSHLGLQAGDLVTSINGTPLDDPNRGNEIFRTLGSSSEARVSVMRNGRQQDLVLNLSQVANEAQQTLGATGGASGAVATSAEASSPDAAPASTAGNPLAVAPAASAGASAQASQAAQPPVPAPAPPAPPASTGPAE